MLTTTGVMPEFCCANCRVEPRDRLAAAARLVAAAADETAVHVIDDVAAAMGIIPDHLRLMLLNEREGEARAAIRQAEGPR